eukprot:TRINITY_DN11934_c0_g1_i1.p1 TRINITY_DN11934_c0_g1~~TRINITY_DN11934_c0_g1_i1.p1  ORF type:complete len:304 (-),score=108.10 TRINITY_DN11934_c0_g1_i1:231-1142(-)
MAENLSKSLSKREKALSLESEKLISSLKEKEKRLVGARDLDKAKDLQTAVSRAYEEEDSKLVEQEKRRQKIEKEKLDASFEVMTRQFEEKWEKLDAEAEAECIAKESALKETHNFEWKQLEESIEVVVSRATLKYSPKVIEMQDTERRLLALGHYMEAKEVHRRLNVEEEREKMAFEDALHRRIEHRRETLRKKQEGEKKFLTQQIANLRSRARLRRQEAEKVLQQKRANLVQDMEHSHEMEFRRVREARGMPIESHSSHEKTSSTYRGSLLLERHHGNKYLLPSLCALHGTEDDPAMAKEHL